MTTPFFQPFKSSISEIEVPEKFTFPFYYEPHPLSKIAAQELQDYLEYQTEFEHNFGVIPHQKGLVIGKMFGVLVCQNREGKLGYLWAFSGKMASSNKHSHFVPPVFDMLTHNSFFKKEENTLNAITRKIESIATSNAFQASLKKLETTQLKAKKDLQKQKERIKNLKIKRDLKRKEAQKKLPLEAYTQLENMLSDESKRESILLKQMHKYWNHQIEAIHKEIEVFNKQIDALKVKRSKKSSALQQKLFDNYQFLNKKGQLKSIAELFDNTPPAGAGECAAPKLLHYAFKEGLKPLCMAEFWWGQSPKSQVRKHKQFYPACKSKCEPILLNHMLKGLAIDKNPFQLNPSKGKALEIIYEDDSLLVVNKPAEFLSVPGKIIKDSVYTRVQKMRPQASGPLIVHRLDMSTSGLLLIAKNKKAYLSLQKQFITRTVKKRYVALLKGVLEQPTGTINLPLRVDLDDRPRQLVCETYGKTATTKWEVISKNNNQTRVYFYPITGRTHQLRVHAAHHLGLNLPIVGDDLYGEKEKRLHLHAETITFNHPDSKKEIHFTVKAPF